jgi:hypothetical protein
MFGLYRIPVSGFVLDRFIQVLGFGLDRFIQVSGFGLDRFDCIFI